MATSQIRPGNEYVLELSEGTIVRVEATSEVWENSKGVEGFDARLLEDFCSRKAGDFYLVQLHLFDVIGGDGLVQCEDCGDLVDESEATVVSHPGATLAFCSDCSGPSRADELGVRA